jgi:hypothetical protein
LFFSHFSGQQNFTIADRFKWLKAEFQNVFPWMLFNLEIDGLKNSNQN